MLLLQNYYVDILNRRSLINKGNLAPFYIKHLTCFDLAEVESISFIYTEEAKSSGIPTIEEKLAELIKEGLWSEDKDREIKDKESFVSNLRISKSKQLAQKMILQFGAEITKIEEEILKLKIEKQILLGYTVDSYTNKRLSDFCIARFLFKDSALKDLLFTEDEFNDLDNENINYLIGKYKDVSDFFNTKTLQKIALSPFFLNFFYLCKENPFTFYGTSAAYLTLYQSELFSLGLKFKNILSDLRGKVDDSVLSDPDKLLEHYERGKNAEDLIDKINKGGDENSSMSMPGLTKEDYKAAGIEANFVDFGKEAKKRGKESLNIMDMIEIQERNG